MTQFDPIFDLTRIDAVLMAMVLIIARFQAFFYASPFFGGRGVPGLIRLGLIVAVAMLCAPATAETLMEPDGAGGVFLWLLGKELALGFLLGMLTWLPLRGFELTGVILDTQRGSTIAEDFDVIFNAQTTPTAIFLAQVFSGYFFAAGGFLVVLTLLVQSLTTWTPLDPLPPISREGLLLFLEFGGMLFLTAVALALPIIAFMLLADIAIAFLAKSAPTLNALIMGMPVKTGILLVMLIFYIGVAYPKVFMLFQDSTTLLQQVFEK